VDGTDLKKVKKAVNKDTMMLWVETPTNPLLKVVDLKGIAAIAKGEDLISVCDNTFASPYLQQPLKLGIDAVVHSTTKYLSGHSDVLGGAIVTSDKELHEDLQFAQNAMGAVPSPFDCFLTLRGIKTLAVRMDRHCENAEDIVNFLLKHPAVAKVLYPGIPTHPGHGIAKEQMSDFGGMVSFVLKEPARAEKFLRSLEIITLGESLGAVESLIDHPASMTHASIPPEQRAARGIGLGLIRLSVGIEDIEDLFEDLGKALEA